MGKKNVIGIASILALALQACNVDSSQGTPGPAGSPGPQGEPGQSITGDPGSQGPQGNVGANGSNGTDASCSVTTLAVGNVAASNGGSLITCSDGSSSVVLNGTNGTNGTNGSNGSPGTVIMPIQFCTGFTQTYPSTFAESGICVDNIMYGVYSANGGFLAELPPGEYSSDGINASCTFTVGPNCTVTQN